jgi:acetyl esterase/lipase
VQFRLGNSHLDFTLPIGSFNTVWIWRQDGAMKKLSLVFALCYATLALSVEAQVPQMTMKRAVRPAEPAAIPLYRGIAPGSEGATQQEVWTEAAGGEQWVRNVTRPMLTPFLPKKGKGNGTAVLVIPGGGFQFVSISNEGWPIAQWLADRGVAAFVLKYRVEKTADSEADFAKAIAIRFQAPRSNAPLSPEMSAAVEIARADAQAAMRLIRGNAIAWGIDPQRVGMLGFSAGAMTTLATTLANVPDSRPDFIAPIYGNMLPVTPPSKPPPMFAALASDDPLFGSQGFGLIESWQKAGGSVEFHYFSGGSHGFGSHKKGTTSDLWFDQFMAWMKEKGLLQPEAQ